MFLFQFLVSLLFFCGTSSNENDHIYRDREPMALWVSTVGPRHNPKETYAYFSVPFCRGESFFFCGKLLYSEGKRVMLNEASQIVELESQCYEISFKEDVAPTVVCQVVLDYEGIEAFTHAVNNDYWYKMYFDRLPVWGKVGEKVDEKFYLYTHRQFNISYNENQIIDITLSTEKKELLTNATTIKFSYEMNWKPTTDKFIDRFDKYLDQNSFPHGINWFGISYSLMVATCLVGLVSIILMRTLDKDYARYNMKNTIDEYGWKQVHGDVFRTPSNAILFSAMIGIGYHLTVVLLSVIVFAILGELYFTVDVERIIVYVAIYVYMATSPINGFFGGSLYSRMSGEDWSRQILVSGLLVPGCVCTIATFIYFIADHDSRWDTMPFEKIFMITCTCIFVSLPLTLVGSVVGRKMNGQPDYPCRINKVPGAIPEKQWFMEPGIIILIGGLLSFGSIFIEMYFIFTSFWAYKIYYFYGFMLLVFCILTVVIVCVSILSTYVLLNAEDYRWHWTSFMTAASISIYVFVYFFYYLFFKTNIQQTTHKIFYFCYASLLSGGLGIICGTVGYIGTTIFVRKIYSNVNIN